MHKKQGYKGSGENYSAMEPDQCEVCMMDKRIRKVIEDMTRDTERLYEKPYLMQAIASHLKVSYGISRTDAEIAVTEYFAEIATNE